MKKCRIHRTPKKYDCKDYMENMYGCEFCTANPDLKANAVISRIAHLEESIEYNTLTIGRCRANTRRTKQQIRHFKKFLREKKKC